jgi:hypothetical protein
MRKFVWKEPGNGPEQSELTLRIMEMPSIFLPGELADKLDSEFYNQYESHVYTDDDLDDALRDICGSLEAEASLIIMTAHELRSNDETDADYQKRIRYNKIAETVVREYPNAYLLDTRQLIKSEEDIDSPRVNEEAARIVLALMGVSVTENLSLDPGSIDENDEKANGEIIESTEESGPVKEPEPPAEEKANAHENDEPITGAADIKPNSSAGHETPGQKPDAARRAAVTISFDMSKDHSVGINNIFKIIDFYIKNGYDVRLNKFEIMFGNDARIVFDEREGSLDITLKPEMFSTILDKLE